MTYSRIILIVLDGFGIGEQPDAPDYGDAGANTFKHLLLANPSLELPNLFKLGLGGAAGFSPGWGGSKQQDIIASAAYGKLRQYAVGKDTLTGHLEMVGVKLDEPFKLFPDGFPNELIKELSLTIGRPIIGNKAYSGTKIIEELGEEQMRTGGVIVYTSADSVLQIAAHEDVVPVAELYQICEVARELARGEYLVGRVIARPFSGSPGNFYRTERRHDYPLPPPAITVLDQLLTAGLQVRAVGKVGDIFTGRGISTSIDVLDNADGISKIIDLIDEDWRGLLFANLNDFDTLYGHRRDAVGYAAALAEFDGQLPNIMNKMNPRDLLIITADHGNDPTFVGSDHTREYVPLLVYNSNLKGPIDLAERTSFADIGSTIAENFELEEPVIGESFWPEISL